MSGEQCFGSRVTLLCTHPDLFNHHGMYVSDSFRWAENGIDINFNNPSSAKFSVNRLNSTASTLSFTVTEEDHRDRVITFTCFLVLNNANRDREESNVVTIDALGECMQTVDTIHCIRVVFCQCMLLIVWTAVMLLSWMFSVEQPLPPIIAPVPTSSSSMLSWTHNKTCFTHHTFTYNVSWTKTPSDPSSSGHKTTSETEYMLSGLPPGEYSVSVQAVCNENSSVVSGVGSTQISIPSE